jgi:ribosomal protein L37AE/L43A
MSLSEISTIKDLIYYQYAKVAAKSFYEIPDGAGVKNHHYGFIKSTFRAYKYRFKSWADIIIQSTQPSDIEKICIYCRSSDGNLQLEYIIPKTMRIKPECSSCEKMHELQSMVWSCSKCNAMKNTLGIYEFYHKMQPDNKLFYDSVPKLLEMKYLKSIYYCHECAGTLEKEDLDGDGKLTVLDIDFILH